MKRTAMLAAAAAVFSFGVSTGEAQDN